MLGFVELAPLAVGADFFVAMIAALFVTLVVAAGWVILWVLHLALGRISVFGFHPFDFFYNFATDAIKATWGYFAKYVSPLGRYIWAQVMIVWRFIYVATETMAGLLTQIVGANQAAQRGLAQLQAREDFFIGQLRNQLETSIANLGLNVLSIEAQLQAKEAADVAALNARITNSVNALNRTINNDVAAIDRTIAVDVAGLNATINRDVAGLNATIANDVRTLDATIANDVRSLTQADATNLRTAENFATGLVSGLGIGSLRQTLTALQSEVGKIKTETTECLDPLCNTVTPNAKRLGHLGDLLKNLETLGVEAIIMALAAECLTHPQAVVEDVSSVVNAVGGPVLREFRDLLGA